MNTISIVTVTEDYRCMNHEQNWVRNGVFTSFTKATTSAVTWVESKSKPESPETATKNNLRTVFVESSCGNFAAIVEEVCILD